MNTSPNNSADKQPVAKSTKEILSQYLKELAGLSEVEDLIKAKLGSEADLLTQISLYLLELGGKRIRPALCLIMAKALGMNTPSKELLQVAAGIELIHMATLLHDDIIDNSSLRRHKSSPLHKYGMSSTLLTGDFLLVRAFSLCAHLDDYIIEKTEQACVELTEGEILEVPIHQQSHTVESSLTIARKKTAALFRLSCETAAHLTSGESVIENAAAKFGENLGIAFQILDDILDVVSDQDILGKESGADIKERKPSLVNILWLESGSQLARALLQDPADSPKDFVDIALKELKSSPVINAAKEKAQHYARVASDALHELESLCSSKDSSEAFFALRGLIAYCLQRME